MAIRHSPISSGIKFAIIELSFSISSQFNSRLVDDTATTLTSDEPAPFELIFERMKIFD